jgi:hypothetical protein
MNGKKSFNTVGEGCGCFLAKIALGKNEVCEKE